MPTGIQSAFKRIVGDKILLALVLAFILILGVGAFLSQDDPPKQASVPIAPVATPTAATPAQVAPAALETSLATEFVKWWLTNAMDYQAQRAKASHQEAFRWMDPDPLKNFQASFWTSDIEAGVQSGQVQAAFQPTSVQAEAVNPDGTVVVGCTGTLAVQANGQPMTQQVAADFLVRKEKSGLRIAGFYNRQVAAAANPAGM